MRRRSLFVAGLTLLCAPACKKPSVCQNTVLYEKPSPDGSHRAVVFERDCGTTEPFGTDVSVLPDGVDLENQDWNAIRTEDEPGKSSAHAKADVRVRWDGPHRIFVSRKGPHVFSIATEVDGIKIEHERVR